MARLVVFFLFLWSGWGYLLADDLPSWRDGDAKMAIIRFVQEVTNKESGNYIPPKNRIAAFDEDGTLWVEQPIYTQMFYTLDIIREKASQHPEWKNMEPFKTVLEKGDEALQLLTQKEIETLFVFSHAGMTVDEFHKSVSMWLDHAVHPRYKKLFTELVYQPMLEVIRYLKDNQFDVYIVSGGGQEFIRAFSEKVYNLPVNRVIGTTEKVKYEYRDGDPVLVKKPEILFVNDKEGKPEGINLIIGARPVIAFGNSIGDKEMLEWTQGGKVTNLELLVHHDDGEREYVYGPNSKVGTFSDALMEKAKKEGWIVISMKNDWKRIFSFDNESLLKKSDKGLQ